MKLCHDTKTLPSFLQVVDVDHVRSKAQIKLIPRIDLQALAAKLVSNRCNPNLLLEILNSFISWELNLM